MKKEPSLLPTKLCCDLCVVGGGVAGICAALASARQGMLVLLAHNRSVLGGNASSEIRQHIGGAAFSGHYPDAREGGIVGELWTSLRRNSFGDNGNDYAESSVIFWDACQREPNLRLLLNLQVDQVDSEGSRIRSVGGTQQSTGMRYLIEAGQFADCTGDGHVAHLAGAAWRRGHEARGEYNESLAPESANTHTMGNTLLFQAEKLDRPAPPPAFDWIEDLSGRDIWWTMHPPKSPMTHGSWVFEFGGESDTIADAESIHAECLKILYSAWADLKRRPECGMDNYRISFISSLPGKRESRRIIGDYTLIQNDIVETRRFPDDVAYAGWSLDLHDPKGFYGRGRPTTFYFFPEIHSIPLRCLYSKDVDNLWMAGRCVSVTHVALGGVRLMATCGLTGEAVGIAAFVARHNGRSSCRDCAASDISTIQQTILKQGGHIPGVRGDDQLDLARLAKIDADSEEALDTGLPAEWLPIGAGTAVAVPITAEKLETIAFPYHNTGATTISVTAILAPIKRIRDFHAVPPLATARAMAAPGEGVLKFDFAAALPADLHMIHLHADNPELLLGHTRRRVTGVHAADYRPEGFSDEWAVQLGMRDPPLWSRRFNPHRARSPEEFHATPCFALTPPSLPYGPANVVNGFDRPGRMPNMWVSSKDADLPQELRLVWSKPVVVGEVRLLFDDDMDLPAPPTIPSRTLVADYDLFGVSSDGEVERLASVDGNKARLKTHRFPPRTLASLRVRVRRMNREGPLEQARIIEVRCYA